MVGLVCFHDKVSLSHLLELMSFSYSLELHESNLYMYFVGVSVENVAYSPLSARKLSSGSGSGSFEVPN